jgi:hypothetical protein
LTFPAREASAIICGTWCVESACGLRYPNGLANREIATTALIRVQVRCTEFAPLADLGLPELRTAEGTPIDTAWELVDVITLDHGSFPNVTRTYERSGPELPAGAALVLVEDGRARCRVHTVQQSCGTTNVVECAPHLEDDCCTLDPSPRASLHFRTSVADREPPPAAPLEMACALVGDQGGVRLAPSLHLPDEADDILEVQILAQEVDAPEAFIVARWSSEPCTPGREREFLFLPEPSMPLPWYGTNPTISGEWRFWARTVDESGNETTSAPVSMTLPNDCQEDLTRIPMTLFSICTGHADAEGPVEPGPEVAFVDTYLEDAACSPERPPVYSTPWPPPLPEPVDSVDLPHSVDPSELPQPEVSEELAGASAHGVAEPASEACSCSLLPRPGPTPGPAAAAILALLALFRRRPGSGHVGLAS